MEILLTQAFIDPRGLIKLNLKQWELLIRQARSANILARLAFFLQQQGVFQLIPEPPRKHLSSEQVRSQRFASSVEWEIKCITHALQDEPVKIILLKGAAYLFAQNQNANGRVFSDVDILVPESNLLGVEKALAKAGWLNTSFDPYEQQYYRKWMHEIPPLINLERQTSLDVHHNILPKTSKYCPDAARLLNNIVNIENSDIWVLSIEDRVLHSAAHLFHEGEFKNGFRDLSDLHFLLIEFSENDDFWQRLLLRSTELRQWIPLFYALRYCQKIFLTPIPEEILIQVDRVVPSLLKKYLMDILFMRALMPDHPSCNDSWTGLARWILYIRSHWLRMPPRLLIPHLARKAWMRVTGKETH